MKSYTESCGKPPFDWKAFLKRALKNPPTAEQWAEVNLLASGWITCATGNQCSVIQRQGNGQPVDMIAERLGGCYGFYGAINDRSVPAALHYINLIEIHSAYLIEVEREKRVKALEAAKTALEEVS